MTVYSNPSVPWYEEKTDSRAKTQRSDDGILTGVVNRTINKKNPETEDAQERVDEASELLSRRMRETGLSVIDPTVIKECSSYKNAGKNFFDYLGNTLPAAGYDSLTTSNGRLNRAMCEETNAKAVLYVNFLFQKTYVKDGVHNKGVAARVVMRVFAANSEGKKIFNHEYSAVSSEYTPIVKTSNYDKEELCSFFPQTVNLVIKDFLNDYIPSGAIAQEDITPIKLPIKSETTVQQETAVSDESAVSQEKKSLAKKLLDKGMSAEEVAELTELTIEEVQEMQNIESAEIAE